MLGILYYLLYPFFIKVIEKEYLNQTWFELFQKNIISSLRSKERSRTFFISNVNVKISLLLTALHVFEQASIFFFWFSEKMAKTFMDQDMDAELEGMEDSDEEKAELNLLYSRLK
mgnify:CR=1 FL=1